MVRERVRGTRITVDLGRPCATSSWRRWETGSRSRRSWRTWRRSRKWRETSSFPWRRRSESGVNDSEFAVKLTRAATKEIASYGGKIRHQVDGRLEGPGTQP